MKKRDLKKGISLVEVVIGSAIILVAFLSLIGTYNVFLRASFANTNTVQASLLVEEGIEAIRIFRDSGWMANIAPLSNNTDYYFYWNSSTWTATTTSVLVDGIYERKFVLAPVYRSSSDVIAPSGTLDANIKKATVTVSWLSPAGATTSLSAATYITNLFAN